MLNKYKNFIKNNNKWVQQYKMVFVVFMNITKEWFLMCHVIYISKKYSRELVKKDIRWDFGKQGIALRIIINLYEYDISFIT